MSAGARLEPDAICLGDERDAVCHMVSIAVSLKRIADAQERLLGCFEYNPTGYNIMDAIKDGRR